MAPDGDPQVIFIKISMASDLVELRGLEPLTPCLQNPCRVSNTVCGLEYLTSTVHRDPAKSRLVGVNLGCQPAPRFRSRCKLRWPLRPEAKLRCGLPGPQHAWPAADGPCVSAGVHRWRWRLSLSWSLSPRPELPARRLRRAVAARRRRMTAD